MTTTRESAATKTTANKTTANKATANKATSRPAPKQRGYRTRAIRDSQAFRIERPDGTQMGFIEWCGTEDGDESPYPWKARLVPHGDQPILCGEHATAEVAASTVMEAYEHWLRQG